MIISWPVCAHDSAECLAVGSLTGLASRRSLELLGWREKKSLAINMDPAQSMASASVCFSIRFLVQGWPDLGMARIVRRRHGPMKAFGSRTSPWLTWLGAIIAAALVAPGCGGSPASSSSVQVWGRVTFNGKPVGYGALIFQPAKTNKSGWGVGLISEDGKFSLVSNEPTVGLQPGRFDLFIKPPSPHDTRTHRRSDEEEWTDEKAVVIAYEYPVPKRFFSPETSGLWVDLEKEPIRLDIDLRD
jgi:hypothetical protein